MDQAGNSLSPSFAIAILARREAVKRVKSRAAAPQRQRFSSNNTLLIWQTHLC
jgi:hypothetical protein